MKQLGFELRPDQWHLFNDGQTGGTPGMDINVIPVWADYTGKGVRVAVFDSGIDATHPDLIGNYLTEFAYDFWNETGDASYLYQPEYDAHGTMVAGFISATGEGIGLRGVAYGSEFTAYANFNGARASTAFSKAADDGFDVMNNSWGNIVPFNNSYFGDSGTMESIEYAAANGRGGLGLNIIFAAGNSYETHPSMVELGFAWSGEFSFADANMEGTTASRFTITVAALDHDGTYAADESETGYTTPGAPILVSAPGSNVVSTDIQGEHGYNPGFDYAPQYGTSFAAPIVSGVVALILEANPNLGYRDVQEILAYSAQLIHLDDPSWQVNAAIDSNGGGLLTNDNYGFGLVDATAAVRLAETWQKQSTYANELTTSSTREFDGTAIPDAGEVSFTFELQQGISVENVELEFAISHGEFGDLIVTLISPSGTESTLLYRTGDAQASAITLAFYNSRDIDITAADLRDLNHTLGSNDFWGEDSGGVWTVRVADAKEGNTGEVHGLSLRAFGSAISEDKTYVYTDDFALLASYEAERKILDNATGVHTLNLAAVSDAVAIDLQKGTGKIAGESLAISSATTVDTIFSGDGNDHIVMAQTGGNVHAGRGDDTVSVAGRSEVDGGAGFDRILLSQEKAGYSISASSGIVTLGHEASNELVVTKNVQFFAFDSADDVLIVVDHAAEAQVARLYDLLLGRTADYDGLAYWIGELNDGVGVNAIAESFAYSNEYIDLGTDLSHEAFLAILYQQTLGRTADDEGVSYWVGRLDDGVSRGDIATSFALSDEANAKAIDHVVLISQTSDFAIA